MMYTATGTVDYLAMQAEALVAYARENEDFAVYLYNTLPSLSPSKTTFRTVSPYLIPDTTDAAVRRTAWLLYQLNTQPDTITAGAEAVLADFLHQYQPQDVVLGVVGLAIVGPTLGLIEKKKKQKARLRVSVSDHLLSHTPAELYANVQKATLGLVSQQLGLVGGDANRLDPELSEWLHADQETELYQASPVQLHEVVSTLQDEELPHYVLKHDARTTAVAVAPTVSNSLSLGSHL